MCVHTHIYDSDIYIIYMWHIYVSHIHMIPKLTLRLYYSEQCACDTHTEVCDMYTHTHKHTHRGLFF